MRADEIARALNGRRVGACWMAPCPVHADRTPSLSICDRQGKTLIYCHAGCEQAAVVGALRARGLWGPAAGCAIGDVEDPKEVFVASRTRVDEARKIWRGTEPAAGTVVESYLATRGLLPPAPERLRFHQGLRHPSGGVWPAMVGLMTRGSDDRPMGIHRTYLAPDGSGKAPTGRPKLFLGHARGAAVRLSRVAPTMVIGEGIETCLSVMQVTGLPAWAACSAPGLQQLDLPKAVRDVIILVDLDDDGAGQRAAKRAGVRWKAEGRRVRLAYPEKGMDFNDMLRRIERRKGDHDE